MRTNTSRIAMSLLFFCFTLVTVSRADEVSVRTAIKEYVEAFNKRDFKTIGALWAKDATHTDRATSKRIEGSDLIVAAITESFKMEPNNRLSGSIEKIRLLKPDVALIEGQTSVGAADAVPALTSFSAVLIQQNGKWLIQSMEEMPLPRLSSSYDALVQLEWLIGEWSDEGDGVRVDTAFRWSDDNAFIIRSFQSSTGKSTTSENTIGKEILDKGTQIIGWDPRNQEIRSWTFHSDGSFGEATWAKSGADWMIKSSQVLSDGQAATGTYVLTRTNSDTIEIKLIGHEVEGEPVPGKNAVKMVRVVATESTPTSAPNPPAGK